MTIATTSDEQALLAVITAEPDDDTPRLMLADLLDELGDERVTCPGDCRKGSNGVYVVYERFGPESKWVKCAACKGIGSILDTSRRDRAELIRVGCELERCKYLSDGRTHSLYNRESALLLAHPDWFPRCACNMRNGNLYDGLGAANCPACSGKGHVGTFRRGFVEEVPVPTIASVLEQCTEDDGPLFPTGDQRIRVYNGDWQPTDYGRYLHDSFPTVRRIVAKDRMPRTSGLLPGKWSLDLEGMPQEVIDRIKGYTNRLGNHIRMFSSAELAIAALALVLREVLWAKVAEAGSRKVS